jgi:hypothetical protein
MERVCYKAVRFGIVCALINFDDTADDVTTLVGTTRYRDKSIFQVKSAEVAFVNSYGGAGYSQCP